ncbi:RNA polymerase factor sigma-54 [Coralliovum pocilloporae]|uniref:RNA polymerase factor sigma-54 n=1 Tax=Coralliovum pocilloporae TaxID=3066369 RepID=UPI003306EC29
MALSPRLEIRQSQSLVMTPQLMQAIKLLQMSSLDISAYLAEELDRNPLLEMSQTTEEPEEASWADAETPIEPHPDDQTAGDQAEASDENWMENSLETSADSISDKLDSSLENVFPDDSETPKESLELPGSVDPWGTVSPSSTVSSDDTNLEAFIAAEATLADHLSEQLSLATDDPALRLIGHYLIDFVDDAGYLRVDLEEVEARLGVVSTQLAEALGLLQSFEPSGVCALDVKDCMKIQLRERDRLDPAMEALVDHLELIAEHDFDRLKTLCRVDDEDFADMLQELRSLHPKPGHLFGGAPTQPIVPEVSVRAANDGSWHVELNADAMPKVLVNQTYYATIAKSASSKDEITYLNDCLQTANWLVKSLDQRARTILKVSSEIVRQQDGFLTYGISHLRPLNLKTVAEAIDMHESTVSRVTSNKYMMTPRGIFELKYFFSSSISGTDGEDAHSSEAVRHQIKELVDAENPKKILSDDAIVKLLKDKGIDIARRTVAKYREAMHIPSSVQRRREKKHLQT